MASSRVSPNTCTAPVASPRRSARKRICSGDSSPETYSVVTPACSRRAAHCSTNVDLPMPGSPPTRTTEPGTIPPPRTKSNSGNPVRQRSAAPTPMSDRRTGGRADGSGGPLTARPPDRPIGSSLSVFHAPQASQRPAHLGCSAPHSAQRNTDLALATLRSRGRLELREVVEAGVFLLEVELQGPRRPVALLADDELREPLDAFVRLRVHRPVIQLLAVDEADHVGVLLDGARLAEVGELGTAVLAAALLRSTRQLRQRDDRYVQLLGEGLEGARDIGDLLLPVLGVGRPLHELEVVHDDKLDVQLHLEPPGFGAHRQRGKG